MIVSLPITSFQSTLQHILYTAASSGTTSGSSHVTLSQTLHLAPHCRQQQHLLAWEIGVRVSDSLRSGRGKSHTGPGRDCRLDESFNFTGVFSRNAIDALAVWEEVLSWWSRISRSPVLGRFSWISENTWGSQTSVYHFVVTVLWSSSTTVAMWPLVEKKVTTIFFPTLLSLLTLVGVVHLERLRPMTGALFRGQTGISKFLHLSLCLTSGGSPRCWISSAFQYTSPPLCI